jgi:AcrR family transcriptional regulator
MSTLTRKQREVSQRELMLLDVARKMLVENGYAGLNMDRLAEATEYSKGTIYQHFSTKEDLVTALALQTMERRTLLFAKAATFKGRPRERFMAIGVADELFGRLHPQYYRSEMIIKLADLEERASAERLATLQQLECSCLADVSAIVESAVALGDLTLPPSMKPAEIVYAVFTLAIGTQTTLHVFRTILENLAIEDPLASSRNNMQALLDGLGWRPLRAEWDYDSTLTRIAREVFPNEWKLAGLR